MRLAGLDDNATIFAPVLAFACPEADSRLRAERNLNGVMGVDADNPAGATNEEAAAIPRHEMPTSGGRLIQVVLERLAAPCRTAASEYILPEGAVVDFSH